MHSLSMPSRWSRLFGALVLAAPLLGGCAHTGTAGDNKAEGDAKAQATPSFGQWLNNIAAAAGQTLALPATLAPARPTIPAEVPGQSTREWPADQGCRIMPEFSVPVDVDTGYARAMRKLNLSTAEMMQRLKQQRNDVIIDPRFRHERAPGAIYLMAQGVKYPGTDGTARYMFMNLTIAKEAQGTVAAAKYCVDPTSPAEMSVEGHRHAQQFIIDALTR
jgi:hypothetical protein